MLKNQQIYRYVLVYSHPILERTPMRLGLPQALHSMVAVAALCRLFIQSKQVAGCFLSVPSTGGLPYLTH